MFFTNNINKTSLQFQLIIIIIPPFYHPIRYIFVLLSYDCVRIFLYNKYIFSYILMLESYLSVHTMMQEWNNKGELMLYTQYMDEERNKSRMFYWSVSSEKKEERNEWVGKLLEFEIWAGDACSRIVFEI
jgi:hypothetical protein